MSFSAVALSFILLSTCTTEFLQTDAAQNLPAGHLVFSMKVLASTALMVDLKW